MKKFYLLIAILFFYFNANSQFTYINVNGGYEGLSLNSKLGSTLTGVKSYTASISVISRFKRHFGLGAKFSYALNQNFEFSFENAKTDGNKFNDKSVRSPISRYYAKDYSYDISYQNFGAIFGRFYFDKILNTYSDVSISFLKINESFSFQRDYVPPYNGEFESNYRPSIPAENLSYNSDYNLISPGIRFGLSPHITDNLFVDFNLGWDFVFFKKNSFQYVVPYDYDIVDDWHNYVTLESQASGTKTMFSINLGIGFYF